MSQEDRSEALIEVREELVQSDIGFVLVVRRDNQMEPIATSVPVDDQQKALEFYTNVLGFEKKTGEPVGEASWLTVVGPNSPDGVELLLKPTENPTIDEELEAYRDTLVTNGIPWTVFGCEDVEADNDLYDE